MSIQARLSKIEAQLESITQSGVRTKVYIEQPNGTLKFHYSFPDDVARKIIIQAGYGFIPRLLRDQRLDKPI